MRHAAAAQRRPVGEAGQRPERQLDHVVIELRSGESEVVQAVDDQHATSAPIGPTSGRAIAQTTAKAAMTLSLRQRVVEQIGSEQP